MSDVIWEGPTCDEPLPFVAAAICNLPLGHQPNCSTIYGKVPIRMKDGSTVIAIGEAIPFGTDPLPPIITDR